jgi:hypothetical protein
VNERRCAREADAFRGFATGVRASGVPVLHKKRKGAGIGPFPLGWIGGRNYARRTLRSGVIRWTVIVALTLCRLATCVR